VVGPQPAGACDAAHPCLVEVDATNEGLADLRGERALLEHFVSDETLIDAVPHFPGVDGVALVVLRLRRCGSG
jgi:hypothetical protein